MDKPLFQLCHSIAIQPQLLMKNISEEIYNSNHIAVEDVRIPSCRLVNPQKFLTGGFKWDNHSTLLKYNYHYIQDQFIINLYFRCHKSEYEKITMVCCNADRIGFM